MTITIVDTIRATVQYTLGVGNIHQNVFHYDAGSGVSDSEANVMAAITTAVETAYALLDARFAQDVLPDSITFALWNSGTGKWEQIGSNALTEPEGAGSTEMMPHGVAAVVRFIADGVGQQGRKFIGGFDEAQIADGNLLSGPLADLALWAISIATDVPVSGGVMQPGWWAIADLADVNYNGNFIINTIVGYQRRRKPGVGI